MHTHLDCRPSARRRLPAPTPLMLALAGALASAPAAALVVEGFETPVLADKGHVYRPTGSGWTFTGVTGAGLQRNGSAFVAPAAPEGMQTAFLKSNDGAVTRTVTLAPGTYKVSFSAARRSNSTQTNPVQVWLDGAPVGAPIAPTASTFSRFTTTAAVTVTTHGDHVLKLSTTRAGEYTTLLDAVTVDLVNPFDALYGSSFQLPTLAADPIQALTKPAAKAVSLNTPSYIDPAYQTRVYRATAAGDHAGASFVRHEYSRRQAFNANNTRYLAQSSNGFWKLYAADTFTVLPKSGVGGAISGMGGDCEPIWHPTDPTRLWYTSQNGGLVWYEQNVETQEVKTLVDFRNRLPWAGAARVWMRGEGTSSADGRYFAFMVESTDFETLGLITWDRQTNQIVGTLGASAFGGERPDHISISPSGRYAIPSWVSATRGTRAYPLDFSGTPRQLLNGSQHSDLAIGPNGQDYLVVTDYASNSNQMRAIDVADGRSFDLLTLRPRSGSQYAAHISGKAFDKPGWVVVSTYADYGNNGTYPDPQLEPMQRKLMLVELRPGGKTLSIAHTRAAGRYSFGPIRDDNPGSYFGEHQASVSRDGSRVIFATNFDDLGAPSSYVVGLPSWVYTPSAGSDTGTGTPPPVTTVPLTLTLGPVTRSGYSGSFSLTTSVAAQCRVATQPSQPFEALYENMGASANGLSHTKTLGFGNTGPQTVYAVCQQTGTQVQKEIPVSFP